MRRFLVSSLLILLALVACCLSLRVEAQQQPTTFQRYYAMMEKRNQLDDLSRNDALVDASGSDELADIKKKVQTQYETLRSGLESNGADSFKSCADVNNNRLSIYGKSALNDGIYIIFVEKKAQAVYCDMTTMGGGFTLVRRVSTSKWWPMDDNFSGKAYGTYDATLAFSSNVVFGLDYRTIPRNRVLITTGDRARWVLVDEQTLTQDFKGTCDVSVSLLASSKSSDVTNVKWCKRTAAEDPWVSINDHFHKGATHLTESEEHSMLWGENSILVWSLWKDTHNGINVFIR